MKEYPIIFSAAMVRTLLDSRKTQTRRIVKKWHFNTGCEGTNLDFSGLHPSKVSPGFWRLSSPGEGGAWNERCGAICPYGKPGDRLWVRETWKRLGFDASDGLRMLCGYRDGAERWTKVEDREDVFLKPNWISPIHMNYWASRITLEIAEVRVQRLQDINEEDCIAEGIGVLEMTTEECANYNVLEGAWPPRTQYRWLWESINGPGSWDANPWVWAVSFKRVTV